MNAIVLTSLEPFTDPDHRRSRVAAKFQPTALDNLLAQVEIVEVA